MSKLLSSCFSSKVYFSLCYGVLFVFAAAASFNGFLSKFPFIEPSKDGNIESSFEVTMLLGTAERPYVYRHLIEDIANFANSTTPQGVKEVLYRMIFPSSPKSGSVRIEVFAALPQPLRHDWFYRYLILYALTFLGALASVVAMYLVCREFALPEPAAVLAPIIVILIAPTAYVFPYDYIELAFLAAAVWFALRLDWWWLLPLAALAAWNKESFFFFMPTLYPLLRRRISRRTASVAVALLTFVCGLVYLYMRTRFANNAGEAVIPQFLDHFRTHFGVHDLLSRVDESYGVPIPEISTLLPTVLLLWTFARVWKRMPSVVRQHGLLAISINGPLYLFFCTPHEYRDLSLLSIFLLLAIAWNLTEWAERSAPAPVDRTV
jgi:hypothetical protein